MCVGWGLGGRRWTSADLGRGSGSVGHRLALWACKGFFVLKERMWAIWHAQSRPTVISLSLFSLGRSGSRAYRGLLRHKAQLFQLIAQVKIQGGPCLAPSRAGPGAAVPATGICGTVAARGGGLPTGMTPAGQLICAHCALLRPLSPYCV